MQSHGFCFFKQSSIESLCTSVLLWSVGNRCLMGNTSGREERLKLSSEIFPPTVRTYRGERVTGKGFSPTNHVGEVQRNSVFGAKKRNQGIGRVIVNESEDIAST